MSEEIRNTSNAFSSNSTKTETQIEKQFNFSSDSISQTSNLFATISAGSQAISEAATLATQLSLAGIDITKSVTNTQQYKDLANTAADAATGYIQKKVNAIKDAWNTKVSVSIESIIGEVAPYAMKLEDIGPKLETKISKVASSILNLSQSSDSIEGVLLNLGNDAYNTTGLKSLVTEVQGLNPVTLASSTGITDLYKDITNKDSSNLSTSTSYGSSANSSLNYSTSLTSAFSSLSIVQAYAGVFNSISTILKIVRAIKIILETLQPGLSIATNLASVWCTFGASAGEASNTISEQVQKGLSGIQMLVLYALKKLVFPIKIKIPALLVNAVDSISVRQAMLDLPTNSNMGLLFNDEFWSEVEYTYQISSSIDRAYKEVQSAISNVNTTYDNLSNLFTDSNGNLVIRGEYLKNLFMEKFTKDYMTSSVALARKEAFLPDYANYSKRNSNSNSNLPQKDNNSSSSASNSTALDRLLNDDSDKNPINSLESLVKVSKLLYENI